MRESLFIYIGTEDSRSENALAKLKVMKEVLRSVTDILWPTNGGAVNVLDAVSLAVLRMSRSDVFKASHNVTCEPDSVESACNVSAHATKSDNVEGNDVDNKGERVIPNLVSTHKSILGEECSKKLNDSMGIVGTDSKGNIVIGTTTGIFSGSVPNNGYYDFYINAATTIGHGLPVMRFNILEVAICKTREENMSLQDAIAESSKILKRNLDDSSSILITDGTGVTNFSMKAERKIWVGTYGEYIASRIQFTEEF